MQTIIQGIDSLSEWIGRFCGWMTIVMMILTSLVVLLRYGFNIGSVALQESISYIHALVFLGAAGITLRHEGHVRVDIFFRRFTRPQQAWVNAVGALALLLPLCIFAIYISWGFVINAWEIREGSPNADGIDAVYWLKTMIPAAFILLALQGIAEVFRSIVTLLAEPSDQ